MKTTFAAALLSASMLAAPAFAQLTVIPMPPAPQPAVTAPPMATGIPDTPFTAADTKFVSMALGDNESEVKFAQLALQNSQDQNIRNYAQKMVNDHNAAYQSLSPIAQRHSIATPDGMMPAQQILYDRLSKLHGLAFDVAYTNDMVRMHEETLKALNDQLVHGRSQIINGWVQNTRPVVQQHLALAQQIKAELPRTG